MVSPCMNFTCPCDAPQKALGRVVHLSQVNGYVVIRNGDLHLLGGKIMWDNKEDVFYNAKINVDCVSDKIFKTAI